MHNLGQLATAIQRASEQRRLMLEQPARELRTEIVVGAELKPGETGTPPFALLSPMLFYCLLISVPVPEYQFLF